MQTNGRQVRTWVMSWSMTVFSRLGDSACRIHQWSSLQLEWRHLLLRQHETGVAVWEQWMIWTSDLPNIHWFRLHLKARRKQFHRKLWESWQAHQPTFPLLSIVWTSSERLCGEGGQWWFSFCLSVIDLELYDNLSFLCSSFSSFDFLFYKYLLRPP